MAIPRVENVAVVAAEQLERSAGPAAALPAFRSLAAKLGEGDARDRAIAGAVRCAVRMGDPGVVAEVAPLWSSLRGDRLALAVELVGVLLARVRPDLAVLLAAEETERSPSARASYLLARCLEAAGDAAESLAAYQRAAARADAEDGAEDVAYHARARRVARLLRAGPAAFAEAVAEAAALRDHPGAAPAEQLAVAEARLFAPSKFTRAAAVSALADLAGSAPRPIADRAVRLAAEHADAMGVTLTALELERLAAVLKQLRDPAERERALARLAALARVVQAPEASREGALRAAVDAAPELEPPLLRALMLVSGVRESGDLRARPAAAPGAPGAAGPLAQVTALALHAVGALRGTEPLSGESLLSRVADQVRPDLAVPAAVWTAARLGLASPRRGVVAASLRLASALLEVRRARPPRGFTDLGLALRRRGHRELAARAFRAAAAAREPRAALELGRERLLEAWALAEKGERVAAVAALGEARALLMETDAGR